MHSGSLSRVTSAPPSAGTRAGGAGLALLLLAGLTACSGGAPSASSGVGGSAAPTAVAGTTSTAPDATAPDATATDATATDAADTPVLPSRAGSPPIPWDTRTATVNAPQPAAVPSRPPGAARLSVLLDNGSGTRSTWTLTCLPTGGNHPDPGKACGVLGANGARALPPTPAGTVCSQIYGGPQQAVVTGTWKGAAVDSRFNLSDGCEVERWNLLLGLLPPGGLP